MKNLFYLLFLSISISVNAQVAINTDNSNPDPSAMLDVKSTGKGILFPRMTTSQRNAIPNPANGLHIFNTDIGSLEYYDEVFSKWIVYCLECLIYRDTIDQNTAGYVIPPEALDAQRIVIVVNNGVTVGSPCTNRNCADPAMDLTDALASASIFIYNYGNILGKGGGGGNGGGVASAPCSTSGTGGVGQAGSNAILSKSGTSLKIFNYGIIGGGGGGGGGGGAGNGYPNVGGGGGSGAGSISFYIGYRGGYNAWNGFYCEIVSAGCGADGNQGTYITGGAGGAGCISGGPFDPGFPGGNGGNLGQPGQNGSDSWYNLGGQGGQPGKAISGNTGNNTVINQGGGVVYGVID